jgi:hypothetical protein
MIVRVGDVVQFDEWSVYKGDVDNTPSDRAEWLGEVVEQIGRVYPSFKIKRQLDGKIVILMMKRIVKIVGHIPQKERTKKRGK